MKKWLMMAVCAALLSACSGMYTQVVGNENGAAGRIGTRLSW